MPVIRRAGTHDKLSGVKSRLAERLLEELLGEGSGAGPVIFEIPTPGGMDVIVVWDAWKGIPATDRTSIIRKADEARQRWGMLSADDRAKLIKDVYHKFETILEQSVRDIDPQRPSGGPVLAPLAIAIGATWDEVIEYGLLPYEVRPTRIPEEISAAAIERSVRGAGGIESPDGSVRLMLPTREFAIEARARLASELPEVEWSIIAHEPNDDCGCLP